MSALTEEEVMGHHMVQDELPEHQKQLSDMVPSHAGFWTLLELTPQLLMTT